MSFVDDGPLIGTVVTTPRNRYQRDKQIFENEKHMLSVRRERVFEKNLYLLTIQIQPRWVPIKTANLK